MKKKLLSLALALALILSMGTVAFAKGGDGQDDNRPSITVDDETYTDIDSVTIKKIYKIENAGTISPEETFTVEQVGPGRKVKGDATSVPDLGTITGAYFAEGAASVDGTEGNIVIQLPEYTTVGVYEYTLREVASDTAGVTYHTGDIRLVVTVMQGEDGKVRVAGVHTEAEGGEKTGSIENIYKAAGVQSEGTGLKIKKTVTGNMADHEKYFTFTVTLNGEAGKTYADSYAVKGGTNGSNPTSCTIGTPFEIYLKADETITIENLPYGVTYTVVEDDYEGYTTSGEVTDPLTIDNATEEVIIENHNEGEVDTGVILDSMPYVLMLAVVAVGLVLFFSRKCFTQD